MHHNFSFSSLLVMLSLILCNEFLSAASGKDADGISIIQGLIIDPGFEIEVFASEIDSPRQLAEDKNGRIYVGSKKSGKIFAIQDSDNNGEADERILVAENLTMATGVSIFDGHLFFSEIDKIWKIENIADVLNDGLSMLPTKY